MTKSNVRLTTVGMTGEKIPKCPLRAFQPCAEHGCALYIQDPQNADFGWCTLTAMGTAAINIMDKIEDYEIYVNVNIQE